MGSVPSFQIDADGSRAVTNRQEPRRNRVAPTGEIVSLPQKGKAMGNRGVLLDKSGVMTRAWGSKRWICCHVSEVHGRRVRFDDPERYTPLFFTDEAVALAAGHRPCGSCRPDAYYHWLAIWKYLTGVSRFRQVRASDMDRDLHHRRQAAQRTSSITLRLEEVPEGTFVAAPTLTCYPALLWQGLLWPWKEGAYGRGIQCGGAARNALVVPRLGFRFLASGFQFDPALAPIVGRD